MSEDCIERKSLENLAAVQIFLVFYRFSNQASTILFEFTRAMATPSVDFLVTKDPEANSKGVPSAIFIVRI
jgi:hypothetical protein